MIKKQLLTTGLIIICLATLGMGTRTVKKTQVIFDMAHREIFTPFADRKLSYAKFYGMFVEQGYTPTLNNEDITSETLKDADTLVLFGPMRPLPDPEILAIDEFVSNGGNLLVMLHISSPAAKLTRRFNILVSNAIVLDETSKIKTANDFMVRNLENHPLNTGVSSLAVFGSWAVMARQDSQTIARTSPDAWVDQNSNRIQDNFEQAQAYGIVAVARKNKGRVVVIADDAPFLDNFIGQGDNQQFAQNVILWFKGQLAD